VDWIVEFIAKFKGNQLISELKRVRFHGKLEINFADGVANTCHVNWCVKPYIGTSLTEGEGKTLTEGGRDGK
jgi:hypothetical protein